MRFNDDSWLVTYIFGPPIVHIIFRPFTSVEDHVCKSCYKIAALLYTVGATSIGSDVGSAVSVPWKCIHAGGRFLTRAVRCLHPVLPRQYWMRIDDLCSLPSGGCNWFVADAGHVTSWSEVASEELISIISSASVHCLGESEAPDRKINIIIIIISVYLWMTNAAIQYNKITRNS